MMKPSTFGFLVVRGVRNLGKHWAMTIACIASLLSLIHISEPTRP